LPTSSSSSSFTRAKGFQKLSTGGGLFDAARSRKQGARWLYQAGVFFCSGRTHRFPMRFQMECEAWGFGSALKNDGMAHSAYGLVRVRVIGL
jgi:hypothetical protein